VGRVGEEPPNQFCHSLQVACEYCAKCTVLLKPTVTPSHTVIDVNCALVPLSFVLIVHICSKIITMCCVACRHCLVIVGRSSSSFAHSTFCKCSLEFIAIVPTVVTNSTPVRTGVYLGQFCLSTAYRYQYLLLESGHRVIGLWPGRVGSRSVNILRLYVVHIGAVVDNLWLVLYQCHQHFYSVLI